MDPLRPKTCFIIAFVVYTIMQPSGGSFINADITKDIQALNQSHGGQFGIFADTSLIIQIRINVTTTPLLTVDVTFPHTVSHSQNAINYHYKLGSLPSPEDISVNYHPAVQISNLTQSVDGPTLTWSFVNVTTMVDDVITITITINPRQDATSPIGSSHNIQVAILEGNTSVQNLVEPIKILGSKFDISYHYKELSSGNSLIQAGDVIVHSIDIALNAQSTSDVNNIHVIIKISPDSMVYKNSLSPTNMTITDVGGIVSQLVTFRAGMSVGSVLQIAWTSMVLGKVSLGSTMNNQVQLTYELAARTGRSYQTVSDASIQVKSIDLSTEDTHFGFESLSSVPVGVEFTWLTRFSLPPGTSYDTELSAVFQTGDTAVVPVFSSVEINDSLRIRKLTGDAVSVNVPSKRKKRAIVPTTVRIPLGDLTNIVCNNNPSLPVTVTAKYHFDSLKTTTGSISIESTQKLKSRDDSFSPPPVIKTVSQPHLGIDTVEQIEDKSVKPNIIRFNASVTHRSYSNSTAYNVTLTYVLPHFNVLREGMIPAASHAGISVTNGNTLTYTVPTLQVGEKAFLSFKAQPQGDGTELPSGESAYKATLEYYASSSDVSSVSTTYAVESSNTQMCIEKIEVENIIHRTNYDYYGYTAFAGILVGVGLVFAVVYVIHLMRRSTVCCYSRIQANQASHRVYRPGTNSGDHINKHREWNILKRTKLFFMKGFRAMKNMSMAAVDGSLVYILSLKDKLRIFRHLDSLDIANAIAVDIEIEEERTDAKVDNTLHLIDSLVKSGDLDKKDVEQGIGKFKMNMKNLNKNIDDGFYSKMRQLEKKSAGKMKAKMEQLKKRHADEEKNLENKIKSIPDQERNELKQLLKEKQKTEQDDLEYRLQLEHDEAAERLRKEYVMKKRKGIQKEQVCLLKDVAGRKQLSEQKLNLLLNEHKKDQEAISKLYDQEMMRQRNKLEEKLTHRKALAAISSTQDEMQTALLKKMLSQMHGLIEKSKTTGTISEETAEVMNGALEKDMADLTDKFEKERQKQELALHQRLSERKHAALSQQAEKHKQEINELERNTKDQSLNYMAFVEEKQKLRCNQRLKTSDLESDIDREHVKELENIRDGILQQVGSELYNRKQILIQKLIREGMSEDQIDRLLRQHDKELEQLKMAQEKEKENHKKKLRLELEKRREEMKKRKELESLQQQEIVDEILNKKGAMISEAERDAIMKEHEENMMNMENNMVLMKLQQKRMLEEKLAMKRAQQLQQLEETQLTEENSESHVDDEDGKERMRKTEAAMLKRHAEQRLAVAQGDNIELHQELDQVHNDMMKSREDALKEQEIRLAAMLTDLQIQKEKEMASIENQQRAIESLQSNLKADLDSKGVLSDPDCQKVLLLHQQEQERLNETLESQKAKQEDMLQRRLADRLAQREKSLIRIQEAQIEEMRETSGGKAAIKFKLALLTNQHKTEMEQFRSRMQIEITNNVEQLRRQIKMQHMQAKQKQELQFLSGLVRLGQFETEELENVVGMLFPLKTADEQKDILRRLMEGYTPPTPQADNPTKDDESEHKKGSLEVRVREAQMNKIRKRKASKKKKKSKKKKLPPININEEDYFGYSAARSLPPIDTPNMLISIPMANNFKKLN